MELKQLERFLAVYDEGSLAKAAKTLGLTQQALSASLANLEDSLGARLFDRGPGGVTRPTASSFWACRRIRRWFRSRAKRTTLPIRPQGRKTWAAC